MKYCLVQEGKIIRGPGRVPKAWNNISNFNLLDEQSLISYGWLPHTFIETATEGQIIEGSTFEIFSDKVVETQISRDPTIEEAQARIDFKWKTLRMVRNYALKSSDWSQLSDVPISTEQKNAWVAYRQQLRDLTSTSTSPDEIVFPPDPNGKIYTAEMLPPSELVYFQ